MGILTGVNSFKKCRLKRGRREVEERFFIARNYHNNIIYYMECDGYSIPEVYMCCGRKVVFFLVGISNPRK